MLTTDQILSMASDLRQEKKSKNPFIDLNPLIYKRLFMLQQQVAANGSQYQNPTIDSANYGRPGLQESFLVESPSKERDRLLDYLLRNGLVKSRDYTLAKRVIDDPYEAAKIEQTRRVLVEMFKNFMKVVLGDSQNYIRSRMMLGKKRSIREEVKKTSKKLNIVDPRNREQGTPSLTAIYRAMTPGQ